ncbi:hypothetical protein [Methanohalophilus halophilus]|uniref:Uncharacterized protein n=1 Tax=Methanohalophilus halophilus TaxID=2177 RepID=A0A1L3Q3J7_9EURY|nr:hypothetical protein [Methanohalophilus halophilus]APH39420.1 hypothetical protein BHR79_07965 [Methanohalophilus halophilus]RNI07709.1 hypothetical protein EFE40_09175 [Methanohalophilus halophilus]SDW97039.1 hypothetical protein SAMN04515625_1973 [Methanohalophilus halophilus]
MEVEETYVFEVDAEVDEYGNVLMMCPECHSDLHVPFINIIDDFYTLEENMVCPLCQKTINRVLHPDEDY